MVTREEEIEAWARELTMHDLKSIDQAWPTKQEHADHRWDQNMRAAELIITARDRYRAARQPAPEAEQPTPTPTPRIEVLKRWLECCAELELDAMVDDLNGTGQILLHASSPTWPRITDEELDILKAHAATLKAQQRGEVRDGA